MPRRKRPSHFASNRRQFLTAAGTAAVSSAVGPIILGAANKSQSKRPTVGFGAHSYECHHGWGQLPDSLRWGETHGVAVDEAGLVYIKHRNKAPDAMDAIVVFDEQGKFVRSFGKQFHGGGHGIDIRKEGGEEFLYLCDVTHNIVAKSTLKGEIVWQFGVPQEPGVYGEGKKYSPTNLAFAPDGGFYVADGYGSHYIHQYDAQAKWVRSWGGSGKEPGKFQTPHGIWLDNRPGRAPQIVVADRANARLQYFTLDGQFVSLLENTVSFPAHFDIRGDELLVPDLHARLTILDKHNRVIVHLGYDPEWTKTVLDQFQVRVNESLWQAGRFIHPHDACYDRAGNIYCVEWVPKGRVTKLVTVS